MPTTPHRAASDAQKCASQADSTHHALSHWWAHALLGLCCSRSRSSTTRTPFPTVLRLRYSTLGVQGHPPQPSQTSTPMPLSHHMYSLLSRYGLLTPPSDLSSLQECPPCPLTPPPELPLWRASLPPCSASEPSSSSRQTSSFLGPWLSSLLSLPPSYISLPYLRLEDYIVLEDI